MTQFLENSIRQALGQPLTIPQDALGISHSKPAYRQRAQPLPDLEEVRSRILKSLKLGTQASGYRVALKALDQFIRELSP